MEIGLALSGGGMRGIAHAGAIKALEENNIHITSIAGSSVGSIIAALYVMGFSPNNILTLFKRYSKQVITIDRRVIWHEVKNYLLKKKIENNGLKTGAELSDTLNQLAFQKNIKKITDVKMPLIMVATDIKNATKCVFSSIEKSEYISDITLGEAVRASSSFPIVYKPFKYNNHLFVDGGISDNIPATDLKKIGAAKVLSIKFKEEKVNEKSPAIDLTTKILDTMCNNIAKESIKASDYVLNISVKGVGIFDLDKIEECFNMGYEATNREMENIKKHI